VARVARSNNAAMPRLPAFVLVLVLILARRNSFPLFAHQYKSRGLDATSFPPERRRIKHQSRLHRD
jgi:hypothetical protein